MVVYRSCGQEKLCSAYLKNTLDTNSSVSLLFNKFIDQKFHCLKGIAIKLSGENPVKRAEKVNPVLIRSDPTYIVFCKLCYNLTFVFF